MESNRDDGDIDVDGEMVGDVDNDGETVSDVDNEGEMVGDLDNEGDGVGRKYLAVSVGAWVVGDGIGVETMVVGTVATGVVSANADVAPLLLCTLLP